MHQKQGRTFRRLAEDVREWMWMFGRPVRMSTGRFRMSLLHGRKVRAGLAVGRGSLAAAGSLDAGSAGAGQELESPVGGRALARSRGLRTRWSA